MTYGELKQMVADNEGKNPATLLCVNLHTLESIIRTIDEAIFHENAINYEDLFNE